MPFRLSATRTRSSFGSWRPRISPPTTWSSATASSSTAPACPAAGPTSPSRTAASPRSASSRAPARREIDADGEVVAPGIVDPHTHYDPQLTFEPYGTSSCFHGVTTVVAGNCGFSVAPLRAGDASWLDHAALRPRRGHGARLRSSGHPLDGFETLPGVPRPHAGPLGINAAFYVGHCDLRRYVMGEDGQTARRPTTRSTRWSSSCARRWRPARPGSPRRHCAHAPRLADRPVPSRLASRRRARGPRRRRPVTPTVARSAYLPGSARSAASTRRRTRTCSSTWRWRAGSR